MVGSTLTRILILAWIILPSALANVFASVSGNLFPKLNYPIDFGKTFRNKPILGKGKTFRGLFFGSLGAGLVYLIEKSELMSATVPHNIQIDQFYNHTILFGLGLGLSALLGDIVKSFAKRQIGVKSGKSWFPFDQTDWILSSCLYLSFFVQLNLIDVGILLILGTAGHLITKVIGYTLKLNKDFI